jgi:hypothetical protein
VTKTALVKIKIVDAGGSNSPSCVDECMETFAWGEVEIEEIVDRSAQVARAAIRDGDLVVGIEEWLCVLLASAAAATTLAW